MNSNVDFWDSKAIVAVSGINTQSPVGKALYTLLTVDYS